MTEEEALKIAKEVYKQITQSIQELEDKYPGFRIQWDDMITTDKYVFNYRDLHD